MAHESPLLLRSLPASEAAVIRYAALCCLALGTFAVGTEGFMIAAILPEIAADLAVSVQVTGLLVTVFAITYALSAPILTALTGRFGRRKLLVLCMAAFACANLVAAMAASYDFLLGARIMLALTAGLYVPNANALASAITPVQWRGRALAVVNGGFSGAVALGVPLGALLCSRTNWRMPFVGVAILAGAACLGLLVGVPRDAATQLPAASLRERLKLLRNPVAFPALLVTTLWALGGYTMYTYIAPYLGQAARLDGARVGLVLFLWGVCAFVGLFLGGLANDRIGANRVITVALPLMATALLALSLAAWRLPADEALVPILIAVAIWGISAWGFFPPQQARLIGIVGPAGAPLILSLNTSFQYVGFSLGAAFGSFVLTRGSIADLGWAGALWVVAAVALNALRMRLASA